MPRRGGARVALALAGVVATAAALLTPATAGGFTAKIPSTAVAVTNPYFQCATMLSSSADGGSATFVWPLGEAAGSTTAADSSGHSFPGKYLGTMAVDAATPKACPRDSGTTYLLDGTSSYVVSTAAAAAGPATFSEEVWFKTSTPAGKLIGFGGSSSGASSNYDRHIYFDPAGQLLFGVYNGAAKVVTSPASYADGSWHQVVATLSSTGTWAGQRLYVDGALVASGPYYAAQSFNGYWRLGYDNLSGWPSTPSTAYFKGSMRYASVYASVLTPTQVAQHYAAGSGS